MSDMKIGDRIRHENFVGYDEVAMALGIESGELILVHNNSSHYILFFTDSYIATDGTDYEVIQIWRYDENWQVVYREALQAMVTAALGR